MFSLCCDYDHVFRLNPELLEYVQLSPSSYLGSRAPFIRWSSCSSVPVVKPVSYVFGVFWSLIPLVLGLLVDLGWFLWIFWSPFWAQPLPSDGRLDKSWEKCSWGKTTLKKCRTAKRQQMLLSVLPGCWCAALTNNPAPEGSQAAMSMILSCNWSTNKHFQRQLKFLQFLSVIVERSFIPESAPQSLNSKQERLLLL